VSTISIQIQPSVSLSAASVTALIRSDTGMTPSGVTPPLALSSSVVDGKTLWGTTFADTTPPAYYSVTIVMTQTSGTVDQPFTYQLTPGNVVGFWTSQQEIEYAFGQFAMDQLSNLNNNYAGADSQGYIQAIKYAESELNYQLALFNYPTGSSFPTSSMAYGILVEQATILAACWLYQKRGMTDSDSKITGAFAAAQAEARRTIKRVIVNRIPDVPRAVSVSPELVMNGFGVGRITAFPASAIPVVP
jgi:hypothetical protein